jgi:hypothetical protein
MRTAPSDDDMTQLKHRASHQLSQTSSKGHWLPISANRRLVLDVLYFSRNVRLFPVDKRIDVQRLALQRQQSQPRISWVVLFCKAYAQVAAEISELRRCYLGWPSPHFYEYPASVATIAINRQCGGQDRLFWGQLRQPESDSLVGLQRRLQSYQIEPVEKVFRRQCWFSRLPTPLRRICWWSRLNLQPHKRAHRIGTFGLSVLAGQGAFNRHHPHFLTSSLSYGPIESSGQMLVTLLADHRVLDGVTAARALEALEAKLGGPILNELSSLVPAAKRLAS